MSGQEISHLIHYSLATRMGNAIVDHGLENGQPRGPLRSNAQVNNDRLHKKFTRQSHSSD